eukprot:CAMPEP_0118664294 /NCGR_PEP_ID=MMETSP0785-20121206/17925_1 /TAXON_ID=91992 /ORGANISM="Bolidomonas pacifica, Strain CCMP 1866" /LENGTH=482 /DNA_ID=CAMNT_0006558169 /DNA_START=278 /DNA_END=1723 /DNA_ORIENTATION=+
MDDNIWSLSSFPDCVDLQNVVWEGDRGGKQGVTLSASFSYPPADLDGLAGCFENVVNVFGGVTCTESDYRWEPDFRSYLDDDGILTMRKVSVSQTICRENVHTFLSAFPCSTHSSLTGAYDASEIARAEGIRMKLSLDVKNRTLGGELEVRGMGGNSAIDYLGKDTIEECPLTTSSSLSILLPSGYDHLEGANGGDYENVDGQWNKVGWGMWGLWNMGGTVYNSASLDNLEDITLHLVPPRTPPSPRWTFDKSVAQGLVDGEGEVTITVTNGHSTCGADITITDFVNGKLMEPDYTTLRVEGNVEDLEISKSLPYIGATVTLSASFKLNFGETAKLAYSVRSRWRPVSEWPPYANRGVELGRGQVEVTLKGKCGVKRTSNSKSPPHFLVDNNFKVTTASPFLHVPHPDMSMPFNVITLTGTVVAFIVGTVFNVTVRKGGKVIKEKLEEGKEKEEGKLKKKLRRIGTIFSKLFTKEKEKEKEK